MTEKVQVFVGCQVQECAEEVSYHLDMVRFYKGKPICQDCYDDVTVTEMSAEDWDD